MGDTPKAIVIDGSKVPVPTVDEKIEEIQERIEQYKCGLISGLELSACVIDEAVKLGFSAEVHMTEWERNIRRRNEKGGG